jgi:hypothetical protein
MWASIARILDLIPTTIRQIIPLNGIFAEAWQPSTAIALYWFESVLLAIIAIVLCWRLERRTSNDAIASAHASGDTATADALGAEQRLARDAGIEPRAVLLFHGAGLAIFGVFLGAILLILISKKHLPPFDWEEFRDGADALMLVIAAGFALEMLTFRTMDVAAVQSRVNACLGRWALLWLLGFVGTMLLVFTGRPGAFIGWFAILKATWEGWGTLARLFGWTSLQTRAQQAQS